MFIKINNNTYNYDKFNKISISTETNCVSGLNFVAKISFHGHISDDTCHEFLSIYIRAEKSLTYTGFSMNVFTSSSIEIITSIIASYLIQKIKDGMDRTKEHTEEETFEITYDKVSFWLTMCKQMLSSIAEICKLELITSSDYSSYVIK